jgi:hypothetical protein
MGDDVCHHFNRAAVESVSRRVDPALGRRLFEDREAAHAWLRA